MALTFKRLFEMRAFESAHLKSMPHEQLRAETHDVLSKHGFDRTGAVYWENPTGAGYKEPNTPQAKRDLSRLGWKKVYTDRNLDAHTYHHPNGLHLYHSGMADFFEITNMPEAVRENLEHAPREHVSAEVDSAMQGAGMTRVEGDASSDRLRWEGHLRAGDNWEGVHGALLSSGWKSEEHNRYYKYAHPSKATIFMVHGGAPDDHGYLTVGRATLAHPARRE